MDRPLHTQRWGVIFNAMFSIRQEKKKKSMHPIMQALLPGCKLYAGLLNK